MRFAWRVWRPQGHDGKPQRPRFRWCGASTLAEVFDESDGQRDTKNETSRPTRNAPTTRDRQSRLVGRPHRSLSLAKRQSDTTACAASRRRRAAAPQSKTAGARPRPPQTAIHPTRRDAGGQGQTYKKKHQNNRRSGTVEEKTRSARKGPRRLPRPPSPSTPGTGPARLGVLVHTHPSPHPPPPPRPPSLLNPLV